MNQMAKDRRIKKVIKLSKEDESDETKKAISRIKSVIRDLKHEIRTLQDAIKDLE